MDFWFSEMHTNNVKMSIRVEKQLFSGTSDFQRIDVFESEEFGRFITSDGSVIFSEKDEFVEKYKAKTGSPLGMIHSVGSVVAANAGTSFIGLFIKGEKRR